MRTPEFLRFFRRIDFLILLPALALMAIGLLSIYSATHTSPAIIHFQKQVFWLVISVLLILLLVIAPPRFYHYSAWIIYLLSLASLLLVLLFGRTVSGNAGWFRIGGFGIQPAEFGKAAVIIALARFLSDPGTRLATFRDLAKALGIVLLPWALIFLQPDFGSSLVYLALFVPIIFWAGAEMFTLLVLVSPVLVAIIALFNVWAFLATALLVVAAYYLLRRNLGIALIFLSLNLSVGFATGYLYEHIPEYQRKRIAVFIDPAKDPQSAGYNVIQSKVAIGSGGLAGKGYLRGSQTQLRFIPEQWTDFIFCVPAEEFGFLGAAGVLLLYALIIWRGLKIAYTHGSRFAGLLCVGIVAAFSLHVFINVGMTLGLTPVIGLPLPFLSYGGSSVLTSAAMIGLLLHAYAYRSEFE